MYKYEYKRNIREYNIFNTININTMGGTNTNMKYKLEITFKDNTKEEYFTNHLNVEYILPSEHLNDIKTINVTHYENN